MGKATLVVMAAGIGSRYGGIKQLGPGRTKWRGDRGLWNPGCAGSRVR